MDGEWMSGSLGGWMDDDGCMDVMNQNLSFFLSGFRSLSRSATAACLARSVS